MLRQCTLMLAGLMICLPAMATGVIVAQVQRTELTDLVEALGTLKASESVTLTALVTETVSAVHFDDGARVAAGQVLVEMTSAEEQALLNEARVARDDAERQLKRVRSLARQGSASESLLDQQQRDFDTARARLEAIESRLGDRVIKAPFAGVVGLRQISVGALVNPGEAITTLDDDRVMKLDFPVPSVFLPSLEKGLAIEARAQAWPDQVFSGRVAAVDSRVDPLTRSVLVRALIDNPDRRLRPGLLMQVALLSNARSALVVPEEALEPEGRQQYVWQVQADSSVVRVPVQVGSRQPGRAEILSGLQEGDRVVIHGHQKIRPGVTVTPRLYDGSQSIAEMLRTETGSEAP